MQLRERGRSLARIVEGMIEGLSWLRATNPPAPFKGGSSFLRYLIQLECHPETESFRIAVT